MTTQELLQKKNMYRREPVYSDVLSTVITTIDDSFEYDTPRPIFNVIEVSFTLENNKIIKKAVERNLSDYVLMDLTNYKVRIMDVDTFMEALREDVEKYYAKKPSLGCRFEPRYYGFTIKKPCFDSDIRNI